MMNVWELPTSLNVGGENWNIRTDFREIIEILQYFSDPEYEDVQWDICLDIFYEDFANMPPNLHQEAAEKAIAFIDMGISDDGKAKPHTMDWEQDAPVIIPSVNRVLGKEIRTLEYLHWWTFLGAYMEIGESLFTSILDIRQKKIKGKKLEKWERDFYRENKQMIDLKKKYTEEEKAAQEQLKALFD